MSRSRKSVRIVSRVAAVGAIVVVAAGCASDDDAVKDNSPQFVRADTDEPVGVYEADEAFSVYASPTNWRLGEAAYVVESVDAKGDFVILRSDPENTESPGKFTRVDFTLDSKSALRLCVGGADAKAMEEAAAAAPDASDLERGCAGGAWSTLALPKLSGTFTDDFDTTYEIDNEALSMQYPGSDPMKFEFLETSNQKGYFLAQNDASAAFSPSLYSRFDYFTADDQSLYYCQTVYDAPNLKAARDAEPALRTSLEKGCGQGFAWSKLTRK